MSITICASNVFGQSNPEILYYDFNGSGTNIPNLATNPPVGADTANIVGSLFLGGIGQCNTGAIVGSGNSSSTDYVNTNWAPSIHSSWTLSFWTSNVAPSATLYYIFGDVNATSWRCFTNGVAGPDNWLLRGPHADVLIPGGATVAPHLNTWVYDDVAGEIRAYLDGALVTTVPQVGLNISGTGPLKVMGHSSFTGMAAGGLMDEFRLYDRALAPAEIMDLIAQGGGSTEVVSACDSYYWPADTTTYTTSGLYSTVVPGSSGCDSTLYLDLTINTSVSGATETIAACDSFVWLQNGLTYTISGMYTENVLASSGCDSTLYLDLTINSSVLGATDTIVACDSFVWQQNGMMYTTGGFYTENLTTTSGCDSMLTLDLTINLSTSSSITETALDVYSSPAGNSYTTSGIYTDVIANAVGCDSTITIDLTVQYTSLSELNQFNVHLYPNPTSTTINVFGMEQLIDVTKMYITSISGECVLEVPKQSTNIEVESLVNGIYFLNIDNSGGLTTLRFVKN